MAQRRGSRANAQRQSLARRQADKERRQEQWAQDQTRKLALVDTAYAAANDYMLERYDRAMVDERWISPRGPSETHTSYYQRVGRHQAQIEELARPLRERASNGHTLRPSLEAHGRRGTRRHRFPYRIYFTLPFIKLLFSPPRRSFCKFGQFS